jgi:hypothetical protein
MQCNAECAKSAVSAKRGTYRAYGAYRAGVRRIAGFSSSYRVVRWFERTILDENRIVFPMWTRKTERW